MNYCGSCNHLDTEHDIAPRDDLPGVPDGTGKCQVEGCLCECLIIKGFETMKKEVTPEQLQALFEASIQLMDSAIKDLTTAWKGIGIVLMSSQVVPPKEETDGDSPTDQTQS